MDSLSQFSDGGGCVIRAPTDSPLDLRLLQLFKVLSYYDLSVLFGVSLVSK